MASKEESRTFHPVDEMPPPGRLLPLSLQFVVLMATGCFTVPYVVGKALGLPDVETAQMVSASVVFAGLGTILTSVGFWRIGARLPVVLGPAGVALGPAILIGKSQGLPAVLGTCAMAGVALILFAPFIARLKKLFPPIVMGTMLIQVGIMLIPLSVGLITGNKLNEPIPPKNLLMAGGTIVLVALLTQFLPASLRRVAVLIGLLIASALAIMFGEMNFHQIWQSGIFGLSIPADFGTLSFSFSTLISAIVIMLIIALEIMPVVTATGDVVGKAVSPKTISGALYADGIISTVGAFFGILPLNTYAHSIGVVALTQTRSRYIATAAGAIFVILGLFPPLGRLFVAIPGPIIGGISLVLFASTCVLGFKTLNQVDLANPKNIYIVATSLGIGFIPLIAPHAYSAMPGDLRLILDSPVGAGVLSALFLNFLFNRRSEEPFAERAYGSPAEPITRPVLAHDTKMSVSG